MTQSDEAGNETIWQIDPSDDPVVVGHMQRLVVAAAAIGGQPEISVVHVDNWFGERWLGFRGKLMGAAGVRTKATAEDPEYSIPPFHPNRILSERRFRLGGEGRISGPFECSFKLHGYRPSEENTRLTFGKTCGPGTYAWCSGKTRANDRASLMVYTHSIDGTSAWYVALQKTGTWRVSRRIGVGDTEWHRLLEEGGVPELK